MMNRIDVIGEEKEKTQKKNASKWLQKYRNIIYNGLELDHENRKHRYTMQYHLIMVFETYRKYASHRIYKDIDPSSHGGHGSHELMQ